MAHQYVNAYSISVRTDPNGGKRDVFLTFYQDYPIPQGDGAVKNIREAISTILMGDNVAKTLSDALANLLKEQETQHG